MGNKQTEEVITDYFSELLSDNTDSKSTDTIDSNIDGTEKPKTTAGLEKSSPEISISQHKIAQNKQDALPLPESEIKVETTIAPKPSLAKEVHHERAPRPYDSVTNTKENVTDSHQKNSDIISDETKTKLVEPKPLGAPKTKDVKIDNDKLPAIAYEQHKQRLEKMLMQVSPAEANPQTKITAPEVIVPVKPESETKSQPTSKPLTEDQQVEQIQTDYQPLPTLSSEWLENGRPNWAQDKFDILLIEVNGLQLAVPLVALGQIQKMDENLTPLFGQSDWFMGLQKSPAGNIKTVNTAKFVMPERYKNEHDYKFVVSINGLNWGLAVDRIHQPIAIDPDSIRWRVNRSSRPWMAGMVKDHMCVLLDIPSMGELLQQQDKNH